MHASCCEGQGTRLFGSLPEFVFSLDTPMNPRIVRVNLYTASSLTFSVQDNDAVVNMSTLWPYESTVVLSLSLPASAAHLVLALRSPEWLPYPLALVVHAAARPFDCQPESPLLKHDLSLSRSRWGHFDETAINLSEPTFPDLVVIVEIISPLGEHKQGKGTNFGHFPQHICKGHIPADRDMILIR